MTRSFVFRLRNSKRKLYLYDENRFRLYNPVFLMKLVLIVHPNSIDQLKEWLDLI
jgi:hypothetical protein